MRKTNRFIALLLTLVMLVGAMPLGVFAADSALSYESEIYTDDTLAGYKQYETMWTDSDYVKGDAKITVYFDKENATEIRDAIIYVINWNDTGIGRIGKDSDVDIVTDYVKAGPSVETKHRAAVIVVDYGNNPLAVATVIEKSLAVIRHNFVGNPKSGNGKLTVWADPAAETKTTTTVTTSASNVYVLPAGYRVMRDIPYFETDVHAALGTFKSIINAWNSHIAYNPALVEDVYLAKKRAPRAIRYAYHTGDTATCTYDHATYTEVECYKGAPQEIDGVIVPYENVITHTGDKTTCPYPHSEMLVTDCTKNEKVNIHWAPVVDRIEDCRKPDGSPLNFVNRLDIIYPSGSPDVKTPVFVQAATHSPRMHNIGVIGDVTTNHKKLRTSLVGFTFSGYVGAVYDYVYIPMARDDHFNYIDPYLTHNSNGAKTSRAAIRCIRYYAEELGFDAELIGVAGISKGTPSVGVLSTINNKYVVEQGSPKYVIDGVEVSTNTAGYFEGDLNDDGTLTKGRTVQPYLSYDQGYDGTVTYDDEGNVVNEISSEISVAYCAAGDGINWIYNGNSTIKLGATNSVTGEETQHVPMVLSCGYHDEYDCWDHWDDIQARFTEYADNPFIAISMEDMGHDYPAAIDPIRDYDRYLAYVQFFHSVLKPELYTSQVAWMTPVNGAKDVPVGSQIQVQLIKPAASLETFAAATTVKDQYGNTLSGTWSTNAANTSGLYTFTPDRAMLGGLTFTVTVGSDVVAEKTSKSFTTEAKGSLFPVADTYVSELEPDRIFGSEKEVHFDSKRTYLVSFKTADFKGDNRAYLNLPVEGTGSQNISVYLIDGYKVDEATLCYNNMPALKDGMLIGSYELSQENNVLDLMGIAHLAKGEYFTLAVNGDALYYFMDFEGVSKVSVTKNNVAETIDGTEYTHYHGYCNTTGFAVRSGGDLKSRSIATYSGNKVFKAESPANDKLYGGYSKIFNALYDNVNSFSSQLAGQTYNYSVKAKFVGDLQSGAKCQPSVSVGFIRTGGNNWLGTKSTITFTEATKNTWQTLTGSYTVPESEIAKKVTSSSAPKNRISYPTFGVYAEDECVGTNFYTYYFDNIIIEDALSLVTSLEDTSSMTAYITTEKRAANGPVADTYVSEQHPDTVLGARDELVMSGGVNENIIFATFSTETLKDKSRLEFIFPISGEKVNAELFLLDGYYVDEQRLTYNNMPELSSAVSLGVHTLTREFNTVVVEDIASKIKGEYFTIAFKSTDSNTHGYRNDFEGYKVGQTFSDGNKDLPNSTLDNNVYDATETSILHYYGFTDSNRDVKYTLARRGGNLDRSVIADPENADNKVLKANTSSGVTNAGRLKIYNALLDRVITTDDVGRTFRFTVKVKAGKASTADPSTLKISISPMLSYGWTVISRSTAPIATTATATSEQLQAGWVTISCDYTVSEKDIKSSQNNGTVYAYPMFNIEFYNGPVGVYNQYLVDDISVVELDENGNEMAITLPSSEAGENSVIIRGRTDSDPVADTYVSAVDIAVNTAEGQKAPGTDKDNIYGNGDFLFVSGKTSAVGERVALISYSNKAITEGDILSLNLPVVNDTSAKVNLYILSDYLLDESKMNYTLYESEVKSKMTLVAENVSLSEGTQKISLGDAQLASGDYFTVIITAAEDAEHVYFNDFERWEAGTHGNTNNKNSLYTSYLHEVDSTAYKNSVGDFIGYSDKYFYVRGSDPTTSYMSVVTDPDGSDNNALMHQVATKGPRIKFVNSLSFDALTAEDVGDTYRATFRMKAVASNGKAYTQNSKMGALRVYGSSFEENTATVNNKQTVSVVTGEDWKEFTYDYVIDANDIKADANGINYNDPLFAIEFASNSTATVYYYIDDLQVIKLEDGKEPVVKVASLENTDLEAVVPSAVTFDSTTPVADTYVSNYYVDKAFGTENVLKFGDSPDGEKFAMALTFSAEAIKNGRYMALKLPEMTAEVKDVHVYYLSDYAVDESATTWNNLPDYKGNLVGVYDLAAGENRLDVTAIADKLEGEYFTLIFRTEHFVYKNGFDNIAKNKSLAEHNNNVKDAEITSRLHYYPYTDKAYTYTATRRGGALGSGALGTRKVIALEGAPSGTQVLSVPSSSSETYGGYLKFYNALMTDADSDIAGKTFRYSVKVKLAGSKNTDSTSRACLAEAGVITSFGNVFLDKQTASAEELQAGWVTLTGTYTIDKANIDEYRKSNTSSAYNYSFPMFGVYFEDPGTAAGTYTYYVDDMSMVELVDGEPVNTLTTIASREADGGAVFVSGLDNAISIIETSVSSASEGAVITVVDNGSTHTLLEAANGKLSYNGITLLDSKGEAIVIGDEAVAAVAIYDDVNRTVRFAVGNAIAYYADGEEIKATFELPAIESGVSDKAVLGSKAITAKKLTRPEPKIVGDQINDITNSVRFVSGVDCLYFNSVGFRIVNSGSAEDKGNASYRVFTEIHADDKLVSAKILGYNYLAAIEIEDVNSSSVIKVTPYVTVGENVIEGKAIYYAITLDSKVAVNVTDSTQFVTPEAE